MDSLILSKTKSIKELISPLNLIYVFAICEAIILTIIYRPDLNIVYPDTWTYLEAWKEISKGHFSVYRTPFYPVFMGILNYFFRGDSLFWVIAIIQYTVFLYSIKYFYLISEYFISKPIWRYGICWLYILHPCLSHYAMFAITESFAISGIIFLFYLLCVIWSEDTNIKTYILFWFITFILIMLRPGFIYLFPILFIYSLLVFFKNNRKGTFAFFSIFLSLTFVLSYCYFYKQSFGIWGLSSVSNFNQHMVLCEYDLINNTIITPQQEKALEQIIGYDWTLNDNDTNFRLINEGLPLSPQARVNSKELISSYDLFIKEQLQNNKIGYLKTIPKRFISTLSLTMLPLTPIYSQGEYILLKFITPGYNTFFISLMIFTIYLIIYLLKTKRVPLLTLIYYFTVIGGIFTAIIGSFGEYIRLTLPIVPLFLILNGILLDNFRLDKINTLL